MNPAEHMLISLGITEPKEIDLDTIASRGALSSNIDRSTSARRQSSVRSAEPSSPSTAAACPNAEDFRWPTNWVIGTITAGASSLRRERRPQLRERCAQSGASGGRFRVRPHPAALHGRTALAQDEETHSVGRTRNGRRILRKLDGDTGQNDGVELVSDGDRLPQQDEAALV